MEITLASNQGITSGHPVPTTARFAGPPTRSAARSRYPRCAPGACVATLNQDIRFDGGDRIVTSGGPISFVHNQDPKCFAGCATNNMTIIGGATEVLSKQAFQNATSYSIPIGENLWTGNGTVTEPFQYAALEILAFEDNTDVVINSPGSGTLTLTLNRGEHFTTCYTSTAAARRPCATGQIDGPTRSVSVNPTITLNAGTKVSTTQPISGLMFAAGDGTFATHFMPLLPDLLHGTDYIIPSVGDYPNGTPVPNPPASAASVPETDSRPTNHYIFNPDPDNNVVVSWVDSVGSGTVTVPPNTTVNYCAATGRAANCVPANSTVRLTSNRRFWGVTIHDHQNVISDWSLRLARDALPLDELHRALLARDAAGGTLRRRRQPSLRQQQPRADLGGGDAGQHLRSASTSTGTACRTSSTSTATAVPTQAPTPRPPTPPASSPRSRVVRPPRPAAASTRSTRCSRCASTTTAT